MIDKDQDEEELFDVLNLKDWSIKNPPLIPYEYILIQTFILLLFLLSMIVRKLNNY